MNKIFKNIYIYIYVQYINKKSRLTKKQKWNKA